MTKYMAKEFGSRGIRVNVVAPGPMETDLGGGFNNNQGLKDFIGSQTTLGRIGITDDLGSVVALLCTP